MTGANIGGRVRALDALRGIAALVVMGYHMRLAFWGGSLHGWLVFLRPVFGGPAAVYIFFVLSGVVLFISLRSKDGFRYGPYILKRSLRLYLPLAAAVIASAALCLIVKPTPVAIGSAWLNGKSWSDPVTPQLLFGHLALLDPSRYQGLDNVIWSLVHEIRISAIFPLLALGIVRWPRQTLVLTAALAVGGFYFAPDKTPPHFIDLLRTSRYIFLFAAGAWMAHNRDRIVRAMGGRLAWVALAAVWVLLSFSGPYAPWAFSAGSILLVAAVFGNHRIAQALESTPLIWLGEVSFSLYLIHLPVLLVFSHALVDTLPPLVIIPISVATALIAAHLFMLGVERPALKLGRWAAAEIFYRRRAQAEA